MTRANGDLPDFAFPLAAWSPDPATGDADDDGVREIHDVEDLTRIYFPKTDLRRGWMFVDAKGRCWEAVATRVAGRADPLWARILPEWLHARSYRLVYEFEARAPMTFDAVKTRLFAAVTANPQAYEHHQRRSRLALLREANTLRDVIKSPGEWAAERWSPTPWWSQWLSGEGRCTRLAFATTLGLVLISMITAFAVLGVMEADGRVLFGVGLVAAAVVWSAVIRRQHDIGLSAWLGMGLWFVWSMVWALIHDHADASWAVTAAVRIWQATTIAAVVALAVWPGQRARNAHGPGRGERKS